MFEFYRQLFSGLPRDVWLLSLVTFVHRSGTMVLPFLTLYLTSERVFSVREAGGVLSLYGVGAIGGAC
jgi:predicted MFS family arabinose efflux permease